MRVVADASVAVKWIFHDAPGEIDIARALSLLDGVRKGTVDLVQPEHWIIEIAQATVLKAPERAKVLMADVRAFLSKRSIAGIFWTRRWSCPRDSNITFSMPSTTP